MPVVALQCAKAGAVVFALLMLYALMPAPARAEGLTDAQLEQVSTLLASFNTSDATIAKVKAVLQDSEAFDKRPLPLAASNAKASLCGIIARNLGRGSSGDDVERLQMFLQKTGDLVASSTGFFGPVTEQALQKWQARMQLATSGDPVSTGFGALGPKSREFLMAHCNGMATSTSAMPGAPVCFLRANKSTVAAGDSVVLRWESKNATWASSADGSRGKPNGSIEVKPTETTTYIKHVYNDTAQADCTVTVTVGDGSTATPTEKVVQAPSLNFGHLFSLMGSGAAAVMDGYLSLFNLGL